MSRALRWAGLGCGFLALLTTCVASFACYALVPAPAREAAQGFLADVRAGAWPSALARMSAEYQRDHDPAALQRAVEAVPGLARHTSATLWNGSVDDDRAVLDGVLATPDGELPIAFELGRIDGDWYVELVVVQGVTLQ